MKVLKINSSARIEDSVSRELTQEITNRIQKTLNDEAVEIIDRDLSKNVSLLTQAHIQAFYTPVNDLTNEQKSILEESNQLVEELFEADIVVVGLPIYNFGVPASMKAWADLVARVGITFSYSEQGPKGLVPSKPVYIVVASGGTAVKSEYDFASTWLIQFFNFLGIEEEYIKIIDAGQMMVSNEDVIQLAKNEIERTKFL